MTVMMTMKKMMMKMKMMMMMMMKMMMRKRRRMVMRQRGQVHHGLIGQHQKTNASSAAFRPFEAQTSKALAQSATICLKIWCPRFDHPSSFKIVTQRHELGYLWTDLCWNHSDRPLQPKLSLVTSWMTRGQPHVTTPSTRCRWR